MFENLNVHNKKQPRRFKRWGLVLLCLAGSAGVAYAETPPCAPLLREGIVQHTVGTGETLKALSTTYNLSETALRTSNPSLDAEVLSDASLIRGTQLVIPPAEGHVVTARPKENLLSLALTNGVKASTLAWMNDLKTSSLAPGQRVFIPVSDCVPGPEALIWPITGRITSSYGRRNISVGGNTFHRGIDIGAANNTPVVAARGGRVTQAGWVGAYGYAVYLDHTDGSQTRYAHLNKIAVPQGSVVRQGDVIGWVGSSGASTGPHLHFELRQDGRTVNPLGYLP